MQKPVTGTPCEDAFTRLAPPEGGPLRRISFVRHALHRVLTHPVAMAVKVPVKDAVWCIRGRRVTNPELPRVVRSVLFICLGNICRSPFAAARAEQLLRQAGVRDLHCASAGIATNQANRSPQEACAAAGSFGVSLDSHEPVQLTRALMDDYDLIVVMEAKHLTLVQQRFEEFASRVVLLPLLDGAELSGYERYNIADPFGQSRSAFDNCYQRIDRALRPLIDLVTRNSPRPTAAQPRAVPSPQ